MTKESISVEQRIARLKAAQYILLAVSLLLAVYLIWRLIPAEYFVDWEYTYRGGTVALMVGETPYSWGGVYSPPWTFFLLIPLALLPVKVGGIILIFLNLAVFSFIIRRLGGGKAAMFLFLLTPNMGMKFVTNPNIDFLAALGFLMPPQIGLFFLAMKPQLGVGVALLWLIEAWKKGGIREVLRVFAPVGLAYVGSVALFGPYMLEAGVMVGDESVWWVYPIWPYMIPVGLVLTVAALQHKRIELAILASPFLSPYVPTYSFAVALLGLVRNLPLLAAAFAGIWISYLYLFIQAKLAGP
jgi:hypothetical protein